MYCSSGKADMSGSTSQIFSGNRGEEITKAVDVDNLPCHGIFASHRRWPFETHEVFDLFPKAAGIDAVRYVRCSRRENISAVKCIARRVKLICLVRHLRSFPEIVVKRLPKPSM